jgi:hypothetical protein
VLAVFALLVTHRIWRFGVHHYMPNRVRDPDLWSQTQGFALQLVVSVCFAVALFCGFWAWDPITTWRETIPILIQVNFTRFSFFLPYLWMIAFALALAAISDRIRFVSSTLVAVLMAAQLTVELLEHEYIAEKKQTGITYAQFYSKRLFDDIAQAIPEDKSSYVVGSIGIHPSVPQYNGFRTADAFFALYPKDYKTRFRKAVISEFSRRPDLLAFFEGWGSAAYFFTSEMWCPRSGAVCTKAKPVRPVHIDFDISAMEDLGVRYLFSVPIISNASDLGLTFLGTYEDNESAWRITVYRLPM